MIDIKAKKIFSYLNPFQDILPGQQYVFNKEAIKNRLLQGDIYHDIDDDPLTNIYRKIAYFVTYPDNLFVKLNVPQDQEEFKHMLLNEHDNVLVYAALCYLNKDFISVDLEGNSLFAKTFFNIKVEKNMSFSSEALHCNNQSVAINWVVNEVLLSDSWRDQNFIINNLHADNIETNSQLVPVEFWEDKKFFNSIIKKYTPNEPFSLPIFEYFLKNHKYNPHFLEFIINHYNSFRLFKEHYFNDYLEYKQGNIIHPQQHFLETLIVTKSNLYKWMSNNYSDNVIKTCFPVDMIHSEETILQHYKMILNKSFYDFTPIFKTNARHEKKPIKMIVNQTKQWKLHLFESLVDIFLQHTENNISNKHYFDNDYDFLLFNSININNDFLTLIEHMSDSKKNVYVQSLAQYVSNNDVKLNQDISNMIVEKYPEYFHLVGNEYRTLENLKNLLSYDINITTEELIHFNDKEFNLAVLNSSYYHVFLKAFPHSYIKDEDYLSHILEKDPYFVYENKSFIKFIEKNTMLTKKFIDKGLFNKLSPSIFDNIDLSEYLLGTLFYKEHKSYQFNNTMSYVKTIVNPTVFSNLTSLENILTISHGHFLKECSHLFKHKAFVHMVFKLYDQKKIQDIEILPNNIRLTLDSYKITDNFENFFIKYNLQQNLMTKLSDNKPIQKNKNKI